MAVRLSIAFDTSAESWLNQQLQYDLVARGKEPEAAPRGEIDGSLTSALPSAKLLEQISQHLPSAQRVPKGHKSETCDQNYNDQRRGPIPSRKIPRKYKIRH